MYKALELYPKQHNTRDERIYLTSLAVRNIKRFFVFCGKLPLTQREAHKLCGIDAVNYYELKRNEYSPLLSKYLRMMAFAGITIDTCDVNYAYANVSYDPEEIEYRLLRVGLKRITHKSHAIDVEPIMRDTGITNRQVLRESLRYGKLRSLNVYARAMFWIQEQERKQGLAKRLHFKI